MMKKRRSAAWWVLLLAAALAAGCQEFVSQTARSSLSSFLGTLLTEAVDNTLVPDQ